MKEILPIMAQNLRFQRLYSYYKQQMSLVTSSSNKGGLLSRLNVSLNDTQDNSINKPNELTQNIFKQSQIESRLNGDLLKQSNDKQCSTKLKLVEASRRLFPQSNEQTQENHLNEQKLENFISNKESENDKEMETNEDENTDVCDG